MGRNFLNYVRLSYSLGTSNDDDSSNYSDRSLWVERRSTYFRKKMEIRKSLLMKREPALLADGRNPGK